MKRGKKFSVLLFVLVLAGIILNGSGSTTDEAFKPIISLNEVNDLPDTEIVEKLFIMDLEHCKDRSIFSDIKIFDYKDVEVRKVNYPKDDSIYSVVYSVRSFSPYWEAGNGHIDSFGWILNKSIYVRLIKDNEQLRLKYIGTGL
ncbi:hypothetical protein SRRS_07480 [Sporomusa rhizae]|uniref:hypothetical protein n=1 Tax=Sporomusa rhizae TaxID=357999 RepID=UPI003529D613